MLAPLEIARCPFDERPATDEKPHWTRPELIAEIRFAGVTDDGILREPIFLGLRDDIAPPPSTGQSRSPR